MAELLMVAAIVFGFEMLIMLTMPVLGLPEGGLVSTLDAVLLAVLATPALLLTGFREQILAGSSATRVLLLSKLVTLLVGLELVIMLMMPVLGIAGTYAESLVDSAVLAVLATPVLLVIGFSSRDPFSERAAHRQVVKYFLCISVPLTALVGGVAVAIYLSEVRSENALANERSSVETGSAYDDIASDLESVVADLEFLSGLIEFWELFENVDPAAESRLAGKFLLFARTRGLYDQIRYLDETGMEVIRVNYNGGRPYLVTEDRLQNKSSRYYFVDTMGLARGGLFLSQLDLNVENGRIEEPRKPMLRLGTPLFDDWGRRRGILLLNHLASGLLDHLDRASGGPFAGRRYLLNQEGYYLKGRDPAEEWGFLLDHDSTFGRDYPDAWGEVSERDSGQFRTGDGLFTFATIHPSDLGLTRESGRKRASPTTTATVRAGDPVWKLVSHTPPDTLHVASRALASKTFALCALIEALLGIGSLATARLMARRKQAEADLREGNSMMIDALEREKRAVVELGATMDQLKTAKKEAEAATRSKSEFLANMSHEIRTPMTAILGYTETMLEPDLSESEKLSAVHTVRRNGEHLLQIINDILDISKIEAGKLEVELIPCSPIQIVTEATALMQVRADAKKLPLHIEYIGAVPETIASDPTRLRQILVNLIGNAIKFTETGSVRLITRFVDGGTEPKIQFDVLDTGLGITEEQAGKLFRAFSQADTSTTRKFGGTGLGLNISKRLAGLLGGTINVESKPGEGSTFSVTVTTGSLDGVKMLKDPTTVTIDRPEDAAAAKGDAVKLDCRILLAEDGRDNQRLIAHVLKKAGAEVTVVENGKLASAAALAACDHGTPFDIILMDMQMPVMDGYEATGQLRKKGYAASIIALTAHAMASDRKKCIDAGCDDYASKPIDRKKLIEIIRKQLQKAEIPVDVS